MADECIDYNATGEDDDTGNWYGISVSPSTLPSDYVDNGLLWKIKYEGPITITLREGPYAHSDYDVIRRDIWICTRSTLIGHQEALGKWLVYAGIPLAARDDVMRLVFNHPELTCQHVRIDIIEYDDETETEDEDDDEDEDEDEDIMEDYEEVAKPASQEALKALEKFTIRASDERETCCAVCLEGFSLGSDATKMPCSHAFHGDCIVRWLEYQYVCPLCRFELPRAC